MYMPYSETFLTSSHPQLPQEWHLDLIFTLLIETAPGQGGHDAILQLF